jgi:hypothetical protein
MKMTISHNLITILHHKIVCGVLTVALTSDYYNQHAHGRNSGCGVVVQKNNQQQFCTPMPQSQRSGCGGVVINQQQFALQCHNHRELHINQLIPTLAKMPIP